MRKIILITLLLSIVTNSFGRTIKSEEEILSLSPPRKISQNNPANKNNFPFVFVKAIGPSMCPTLNSVVGKCQLKGSELILVDKHNYSKENTPKRGDVIVHQIPKTNRNSVRRIIGTPGDTLEITEGEIFLTSPKKEKVKLYEEYLSETNKGQTHSPITIFEVPLGQYFVLGDNRTASLDSRRCFEETCSDKNSPFIFVEEIVGKANYVVWPLQKFRKIKHSSFNTNPAKIDTSLDEQ